MKKEFLKAGRLDTPIEVYSYTNTQNAYGEISQSRTLLKTIWAQIVPATGNEKVMDDTIVAKSKVAFLVRWDNDLEVNSATILQSNILISIGTYLVWNIMGGEWEF